MAVSARVRALDPPTAITAVQRFGLSECTSPATLTPPELRTNGSTVSTFSVATALLAQITKSRAIHRITELIQQYGNRRESEHFEQPRCAHSAADAHGDDHIFDAAAPAFDQRVAGHPRAAHAVGVADRDRPAVDVQAVFGDAELLGAVEHLHREGLVQ